MSSTQLHEIPEATKASWASEYTEDSCRFDVLIPEFRRESSTLKDVVEVEYWAPKAGAAFERSESFRTVAPIIFAEMKDHTSTTGRLSGLRKIAPHTETQSVGSVVLNAVRNLGRLRDGWAGPDSHAPSTTTINDIVLVLFTTVSIIRNVEPDVEVDPDTGSVSLRWYDAERNNSLTISFFGAGKVIATHSSLEAPGLGAREFSTRRIGELLSFLTESGIENIF